MELHEALEAARVKAGGTRPMPFRHVRDRIVEMLGVAYAPTQETISQMHRADGKSAKTPDLMLVTALAEIYGVSLRQLSPELADDLAKHAVIVRRQAEWAARDSNPEPADQTFGSRVLVGAVAR